MSRIALLVFVPYKEGKTVSLLQRCKNSAILCIPWSPWIYCRPLPWATPLGLGGFPIRNNMRPWAIFRAFQPYDQPNTCLHGHSGLCLMLFLINLPCACARLMTFSTLAVMTITRLTIEWPPNFVEWPVKSCYVWTFVLTFLISYF